MSDNIWPLKHAVLSSLRMFIHTGSLDRRFVLVWEVVIKNLPGHSVPLPNSLKLFVESDFELLFGPKLSHASAKWPTPASIVLSGRSSHQLMSLEMPSNPMIAHEWFVVVVLLHFYLKNNYTILILIRYENWFFSSVTGKVSENGDSTVNSSKKRL